MVRTVVWSIGQMGMLKCIFCTPFLLPLLLPQESLSFSLYRSGLYIHLGQIDFSSFFSSFSFFFFFFFFFLSYWADFPVGAFLVYNFMLFHIVSVQHVIMMMMIIIIIIVILLLIIVIIISYVLPVYARMLFQTTA